jgi:hypothetical protein
MTPETKSEIIVVGIAGAVLLFIWARNRNAGADTGLENLPSLSAPQTPLPGAAANFNIPAPVPGFSGSYTDNPYALPSPNIFTLGAGEASSCNCQSSGQGGSTFGGPSDLSAWLAAQPGLLDSLSDATSNWN